MNLEPYAESYTASQSLDIQYARFNSFVICQQDNFTKAFYLFLYKIVTYYYTIISVLHYNKISKHSKYEPPESKMTIALGAEDPMH